jgi:hypothetical protein
MPREVARAQVLVDADLRKEPERGLGRMKVSVNV